jgi:hypothetical protein
MGAGIGKMFGIDKIFGGVLDSIGLGALKPLVSTAFDFATGNLPGIMQDLTSLMSQFGNGGFTNNVSQNQPLPDAFNADNSSYNSEAAGQSEGTNDEYSTGNANNANNDLSNNRIGQLFKLLSDIFNSKDSSDIKNKLTQLFKLLGENANNRDSLQNSRTNVQFFSGGITINS